MGTLPVPTAEPASLFDPRLRGATFAILSMVGLSAYETLAVAAALPQLAASLGDVELLPWVVTAYLLVSGVATVAAGSLVDRFGVASIFRTSVVLFVVGSLLAGSAPSMPLLVAGRVVQGIGAGAVNAVGLSAVGLTYPPRLVSRAFAANSTVWGVMSVAGPVLTAALLAFASWRWIFWLNLPLGALALLAGWRSLPGRPDPASPGGPSVRALDLGLILGFTGAVLYGVDALDATSGLAFAVALGLGGWLVRRGRRDPGALLASRHAVDSPLGPLAWAMALLMVGGIGVQTFLPVYVSGGRGGGEALTAWSLLFFVLGWTTGANLASRLSDHLRYWTVLRVGAGVVPLALGGTALVAATGGSLWLIFPCMVLAGVGTGAATNAALTSIRRLVADGEVGRAVSAHQFVRNLGFAVGNALVGAVLLLVVGRITGDVEQIRSVLGGAADLDVSGGAAAAICTGFATATAIGAAFAAVAQIPLGYAERKAA